MEYGTEFLTVEIDLNGCGRLQFEVPPDVTDEEIEYLRSRCLALRMGYSNS